MSGNRGVSQTPPWRSLPLQHHSLTRRPLLPPVDGRFSGREGGGAVYEQGRGRGARWVTRGGDRSRAPGTRSSQRTGTAGRRRTTNAAAVDKWEYHLGWGERGERRMDEMNCWIMGSGGDWMLMEG